MAFSVEREPRVTNNQAKCVLCLQMSPRNPGPGSVSTVRQVGYTSDRAVIFRQYGEKDSLDQLFGEKVSPDQVFGEKVSPDQVFGEKISPDQGFREKVSPDQVKNNIKGLVICLRFVL